ncbi:hypothetical protein H6F32_09295 [Anabaena sp. FACHB-1237]|uniref:hypothetical protein n=1 Tax=Anabaena sp. FACHB-1237 TaxID=2692769 RepID=UPI001680CE75|nr:hypothetical protein [Anabaena sp. FACHB-1237]MBD2137780.1 hypothetical protein [Anabaena sp. FACHB-1237]
MVRYAVNKNGFLLDAERQEYNNKDDAYTCLFCGLPLSFRKGCIKTMSKTSTTFECVSCFAHGNGKDDNINCISDNFVSSKSESETHRKAKNAVTDILQESTKLYFPQDNFQPIQEFVYPGDFKRRADVAMTRNGVGFANFEEQVSPVPFDNFKSRYTKDKSNKVGNTYFAIGEIDRNIRTGNQGVGGVNFSQGSLGYRCLNEFGIVHEIQQVVTKQKIIRYRDTRSNFEYNTEPINIDSYVRFYEEKKIAENHFTRPTPFTTNEAAQLIYDSLIEHEKLLKNTTYIDLQSTSIIGSRSIDLSNDDQDDDRYDTCLLRLPSENLKEIRLVCRTDKGYAGVILQFDIKYKKAKVLLLDENDPTWIDFKHLYVSEKDAHLCLNSSQSKYIKNDSVSLEDSTSYLEIISETIIEIPRDFNPINDFNDALFRKINQIDEPPIVEQVELFNFDNPVLTDKIILDIPNQENKSSNFDLEEPVDIQCTPQLTVINEVIDEIINKVTNEVIDGWQQCGLPDIYDYSLVDEGDRVKSAVEADKYGIVVSKKTQTPPGIAPYKKITVQWDNGEVSHPYPQQLIRLVNTE